MMRQESARETSLSDPAPAQITRSGAFPAGVPDSQVAAPSRKEGFGGDERDPNPFTDRRRHQPVAHGPEHLSVARMLLECLRESRFTFAIGQGVLRQNSPWSETKPGIPAHDLPVYLRKRLIGAGTMILGGIAMTVFSRQSSTASATPPAAGHPDVMR